MASYKVGDYTFYDEPTARKAAGELKAIEYMLPQLEKAKDKEVLNAYNQLIERRMFSTAVGMSFLQQLRNRLLSTRGINKSEVLPLYDVESEENSQKAENKDNKPSKDKSSAKSKPVKAKRNENRVKKPEKKISLQEENRRLKAINSVLLTISLALVIVVVGMFYVSSTINSPNILNYEEVIINKYASWQQDLEEKELELLERERALDNL